MTFQEELDDNARPEFSIVIPFFNEEENVEEVLGEVRSLFPEAEIVAVDDGSSDNTWKRITAFADCKGVRLLENRGQSAAIYSGLKAATGSYCGLMDGDGQNDPSGFHALLESAREGRADIICGYRANRKDSFSKRVASRIANRLRRLFLHDGIRDTGCSMKVFARKHVDLLVPFNGLHRFLPALFEKAGLTCSEVQVKHRPRLRGNSKYTNWNRACRGLYDLIGVAWLLNRKINFPKIEEK